jgi:hypothetical protein
MEGQKTITVTYSRIAKTVILGIAVMSMARGIRRFPLDDRLLYIGLWLLTLLPFFCLIWHVQSFGILINDRDIYIRKWFGLVRFYLPIATIIKVVRKMGKHNPTEVKSFTVYFEGGKKIKIPINSLLMTSGYEVRDYFEMNIDPSKIFEK